MQEFQLTLPEIEAAKKRIRPWIVKTPTYDWHSIELQNIMGKGTDVSLKLELFQNTNTFKPRGALNVMLNADPAKLKNGVLAISGGNHAIAVAYAAKMLGHSAKVVVLKTASPVRRARCESYGAEVIACDDYAHGFEIFEQIERDENRVPVHQFEGPYTAQGTATIGLEWHKQAGKLEAIIVPIGGGGLIAGIGAAFKQLQPDIKVYGVEPAGAPTLLESHAAGHPVRLDKTATIADSLAVVRAMPYVFNVVEKVVDDIVLVDDDQLRHAMHFLYDDMKLAAEPACAAATAALMGPLKEHLSGKRVGVIACGSNLDIATFARDLFRAEIG